ncbi:hypothetical protein X801_08369 [Opisthorchis viverrini]|uniref:Uncharacterized protein n=2 Tax=Opisthorchis viverrini TaxID=6198 RepID=A0A1S8WN41_OPIVI|nr:hypothetical protein X801_08369 [Opisthorchis viverrini]
MPDLLESKNVLIGKSTDDVFRTSFGVGHHWRPGFYFPDSNTLTKLSTEQTCSQRPGGAVKPSDHYTTTTGSFHDPKVLSEELQNTRALPPPHHWNVHYISDFRSRYLAGRHYRPLSPSHQKSETHDEFRQHDSPSEVWRPIGMQPFVLDNHHKEGPSKKIVASTVNRSLRGRTLLPKDKEVLRHLDPYLTTTMKEHRVWTPEELEACAKKDIATYWDLESYPKARGFGLKSNPIPKDSVPRERLPLRDRVLFKEATDHTRVRPVTFHVPHTSRLEIHIRHADDVRNGVLDDRAMQTKSVMTRNPLHLTFGYLNDLLKISLFPFSSAT